jgi:hypothetical protein
MFAWDPPLLSSQYHLLSFMTPSKITIIAVHDHHPATEIFHLATLHALERGRLLELAINLGTAVISTTLAVETQQSTQIELGSLEQLDFPDVDVLKGVDTLSSLLNLTANSLGDQLAGEASKGLAGRLALDDFGHLLSDCTDLRAGSVGGFLDLVWPTLGEGNGEEADQIVVGGLDSDVGLNEGLPLAHQRAQLVGCEVEAVEVGQAVLALHLVYAELDLAESVVLIVLEIGERDFEDAALQSIVGVLETGCAINQGLANTDILLDCMIFAILISVHDILSVVECGRSLDRVPVFAGEGILGSLLETLLAL